MTARNTVETLSIPESIKQALSRLIGCPEVISHRLSYTMVSHAAATKKAKKENLDLFFSICQRAQRFQMRCLSRWSPFRLLSGAQRTFKKVQATREYRFDLRYKLEGMRLVERNQFERLFLKFRKNCGIDQFFSR
ncbi:MAG: hypothetical protein K8F91_25445 [Candidatus Obscuribacterales bacterium]|nr:hypothetical protein [Candidatus Obscuribacterales bacterium]